MSNEFLFSYFDIGVKSWKMAVNQETGEIQNDKNTYAIQSHA